MYCKSYFFERHSKNVSRNLPLWFAKNKYCNMYIYITITLKEYSKLDPWNEERFRNWKSSLFPQQTLSSDGSFKNFSNEQHVLPQKYHHHPNSESWTKGNLWWFSNTKPACKRVTKVTFAQHFCSETMLNSPGWWFQPIWKIWVKMVIFSKDRGENSKKKWVAGEAQLCKLSTGTLYRHSGSHPAKASKTYKRSSENPKPFHPF